MKFDRLVRLNDRDELRDAMFNHDPEDKIIRRLDEEEETEVQMIPMIEVLDQISPKAKNIIYLRIWEGWTFRELGKLYGCSRQWAYSLYKRSLEEIKDLYPDLSYLIVEE